MVIWGTVVLLCDLKLKLWTLCLKERIIGLKQKRKNDVRHI